MSSMLFVLKAIWLQLSWYLLPTTHSDRRTYVAKVHLQNFQFDVSNDYISECDWIPNHCGACNNIDFLLRNLML